MTQSAFKSITPQLRRSLRYFSSSGVVGSISTQEYVTRRGRLAEKIAQFRPDESNTSSRHLVIIPAAETQYKTLHVPFEFRQDSYFRYLTGINEPGAVLVLELSSIKPSSSMFSDNVAFVPRLFVEHRDENTCRWDGPTLGVSGASDLSGIPETMPLSCLNAYLQSSMSQLSAPSDFVWFGSPFSVLKQEKTCFNRNIYSSVSQLFAKSQLNQSQLQNPNPLVDELRLIKSTSEIDLMRSAVQVTSRALKNTMASAFAGIREAELAARFEFESRRMGSTLGYPAVVAGGPRANIIHYLSVDKTVEDGQLVLMDVGSEVDGYTADITRTWPINGSYTREQRLLYEILICVQENCRKAANPETSLNQLYKLMVYQLAKYLTEEGVLRIDEPAFSNIGSIVCPHHVGHYLGLDVHDSESVGYGATFAPGMTFTLEPAIYFPTEKNEVQVPEEFLGLGLRLEDNYFINPDGAAEKLADTLPFEAAEIQSLVGTRHRNADDRIMTKSL